MPGRSPCGRQAAICLHILLSDLTIIALTQGRFQQDADRKGKPLQDREACLFEGVKPIDSELLFPHFQNAACTKCIRHTDSFVM